MRILTSRLIPSALLVLVLALAGPSAAQTRRGACTLKILELAFGEYDVFATSPTRSVARVGVACAGPTGKIALRIELSAGSSQNFASRTQLSGANVLTYNIYVDPGLTQIAGDGTSGTSFLSLQPNAETPEETVNLYGAIAPRQFAPPGVYSDTVYVTLTF